MGRTTIVIAPPGPGYGKAIREFWGAPTALKGIAAGFGFLDLARFDPQKTGVHFFAARSNGSPRPREARGRPRRVWSGAAADGMGSLDGRKASRSEEGPPGAGSSAADFEALIALAVVFEKSHPPGVMAGLCARHPRRPAAAISVTNR